MNMNRYLLFAGPDYYPRGGMHDFIDSFETVTAAVEKYNSDAEKFRYGWFHIYDTQKPDIIMDSEELGILTVDQFLKRAKRLDR
jgi:hypothetical protein